MTKQFQDNIRHYGGPNLRPCPSP